MLSVPALAQQLPTPTPAPAPTPVPKPTASEKAATPPTPEKEKPPAAEGTAAAPPPPTARPEPCYNIASPGQGATPDGMVLIDRCSGKTWLLIRIQIPDDKGNPTSEFTYRWAPILYGDREALLSMGQKPATPPATGRKRKAAQ